MNTHSPVTEAELKDHSTAPRVTEKQLDANIKSVRYLNAGYACNTSSVGVSADSPLHLLTFCILTLRNGFTVTGESACVSPENYDEEIGRRIAYANAKQKVWALMGYALRDCQHRDQAILDTRAFSSRPDMDTYLGTKAIHAKPMCRLDYCTLRGWDVPENENGADEGYLVEYTDRILPAGQRIAGYLGYISWSPKETFEKAYRPT